MSFTLFDGVMAEEDAPGPSELQEFRDWLSLSPGSPVQAPFVPIPQPPVLDISTSPSPSPESVPVVRRKQAPVVAYAQAPVVANAQPPVVEISTSPSTSPGSVRRGKAPVIKISSSASTSSGSISNFAIPRLPVAEISASPSTSQGSIPVVGRKRGRKARPSKQVLYVEVTEVEPPALLSSTADEFEQMLARTEWRKEVVNFLPRKILVAAPRRKPGRSLTTQQRYNPCSWQEFIERTREAELKKAESRLKRFKRRSNEALEEGPPSGPPDPIGSSRAAVVEIFGERLDSDTFGKYSLFHSREWSDAFSGSGQS